MTERSIARIVNGGMFLALVLGVIVITEHDTIALWRQITSAVILLLGFFFCLMLNVPDEEEGKKS